MQNLDLSTEALSLLLHAGVQGYPACPISWGYPTRPHELEQNRPVDAPARACLSQSTRRSMILSIRYQCTM